MRNYAKTPTVLQMEATECGAASLAMVMAYYGHYMPLEQMRVETAVSRDGVNMKDMKHAAKRWGLDCHGYRKEPEKLKELTMPCIIHWNFNHFVVLEGFQGKYVFLNDPACGRRKLTWEEFDQGYTGVVLTFRKTEQFVAQKRENRVLPFIRSRLKGQGGVLLKLIYIGLLLIAPGLILPLLSQFFIDNILVAGYADWLIRFLAFMGGCLILKEGLAYYRSRILARLKGKLTLISGYTFLSHMMRLPIAFFDQRYAGDLVNRMQNNEDINDFFAGQFAETILNVFTALFYLVILFLYNPVLTAVGLAGVLVSILVAVWANRVIASATIKLQMTGGKLYGALCAGISITDTMKSAGIEMEYSNRLIGHQAISVTEGQKLKRFQQVVSAIPASVGQITEVMTLFLGAVLAISGSFTPGMLTAFKSLFDSFEAPVNQLIGFFEGLQKVKANISRVDDIERYPQETQSADQAGGQMLAKLSGRIELRNVAFGYTAHKDPVVSDFSFRLKSGESIAFVGPSGCGKSTVSKVISGLYRAWEGEVLFDGIPIEQIPPSILHASVATVSQNIAIFSGTIRDNLTLWNSAIPEENMIAAARDACIHDFIMQQPGGYDYKLTEGAANLSGGQRQRMEIARALTVNPSILIMDEATSALDPIVEKQILDNIARRGCTCVIVAHRLSAVRDCQEIVVMQGGKIIERGTHESLRKENGFYTRFIQDE